MRRFVTGAVFVVGVTLALAACSSDDSTDAPAKSTTTTTTTAAAGPATISVTSPDFENNGTIPTQFTCAGAGAAPRLRWTTPPAGTRELALIVFDPDAGANGFLHYLAWSIPPGLRTAVPGSGSIDGATAGRNGTGQTGWIPPCPPPGSPHHYEFTLYALDREPAIPATASRQQFLDGIQASVVGEGQLTGVFGR